jgi:hypothetical protein
MSNATALDFLDNFDADAISDPTENTAPAYRRVLESFFCGHATFAEGRLNIYDEGGEDESRNLELYFQVPSESADADGNDMLKLRYNLKFALKPAAILLTACGLSPKDIRNGLLDSTVESVETHIVGKLAKCKVGMLQVPNHVRGKGGRRYPLQVAYTSKGWKALKTKFGGSLPTKESFGISEDVSTTDDGGGDDPYNV